MSRQAMNRIFLFASTAAMGAFGCGTEAQDELASSESAVLGAHFGGIDADLFTEATEAFSAVEGPTDGLGPIFNERGCGVCHTNGALGGAGEQIERRFGRFVNGRFDGLGNRGGSLRQLFTLGTFNNPDLPPASNLCTVPLEREPAEATVRNVGRLTTPLFGLGLVDAMPDAFFDGLAAAQPASIRGTVNRVPILLPNPGDPSQQIGTIRVGRFGWKAGVPTLVQFSADAYVNEMGITTQSCIRGTQTLDFATESAPNGVPMRLGCDDLAPPAPAGVPAGTDDAVGACEPGQTELQDDVFLFAAFMTGLAPGPRDFSDQISVTRGQPLFTQVGCAGCHVATTFRTPANPRPVDIDGNGEEIVRVPGNFAFNPYSDFLTHDMGSLGDRIGNDGDSEAVTRRMRTAPLWGIRFRNHLLHDGRTGDIPTAVRAHDGQAAASRNAFNALSPANQHNVVQFVRSL